MLRPARARRRKNRYWNDDLGYPPFRSIAELDDMVLFLNDLKADWKEDQDKNKKVEVKKRNLTFAEVLFAVVVFGPVVATIEFLIMYHFVFKAFVK